MLRILPPFAAAFLLTSSALGDGQESRPPSAEAKAWSIATGALFATGNMAHLDRLDWLDKTPEHVADIKAALAEWWGVSNKRELLDTLKWIDDAGHRASFDAIAAALAAPEKPANKTYLGELRRQPDGAWSIKVVERYRAEVGKKSLLGWDYSRYVNVVRQSYFVGYVTEEEAWDLILPAARRLQAMFESWADLGQNYLIGREFWDETRYRSEAKTYEYMLRNLLDDPASPWKTLPWKTKLE